MEEMARMQRATVGYMRAELPLGPSIEHVAWKPMVKYKLIRNKNTIQQVEQEERPAHNKTKKKESPTA